jgi:hypothetical protein
VQLASKPPKAHTRSVMNVDLLLTIIFCAEVVLIAAAVLALVARDVRRAKKEETRGRRRWT